MIIAMTGKPGSSKTLNAIKRFMIPAIKAERMIYTNIEGLNIIALAIKCGVMPEYLEKRIVFFRNEDANAIISKMEYNSVAVIDEAQIIWSNRDFKESRNKDILPVLQKHRHFKQDIYFLTQEIDQIDLGIRRVVELHIRLTKMSALGLNRLVHVKLYTDGLDSYKFKPYATEKWTLDTSIFGLYDSYEVKDEIAETKQNRINVLRAWQFWVVLVAVAVLGNAFREHIWKKLPNQRGGQAAAAAPPAMFDLGDDYEEYYCGDKFYVLRAGGKIDTIQPKKVPPEYCPRVNFNFKRGSSK